MTQIVEDGSFRPSTQYTLSGIGVTTQQITSPATGNWTIPNVPSTATMIQLEPGPVATPFEHRPIGTELALCERYFEGGRTKSYVGGASTVGIAISTNYKTNKRTAATVVYGNTTGFNFLPTSTEGNYIEGFTSLRTGGNEIAFTWTADAEL